MLKQSNQPTASSATATEHKIMLNRLRQTFFTNIGNAIIIAEAFDALI